MNSATLNFSPLIFPQQNINFLFLLIPHLSSLFPIYQTRKREKVTMFLLGKDISASMMNI